MKIGELFLELGAKGNDKLLAGLKSINKGMVSIKESSLATKASIAAATFAVERMTRFSTQMGANFSEFAGYTGLSTKMLQKWQYAGRQANVTNEEVQSSFMGVAKAMGNMALGKGAPEGLAVLADTVGFDMSKAKDTMYVMNKLQEFATTFDGNEVLKNTVLESFGVGSTAMIAAMKQGAFVADKMKKAPIFSGEEIDKLASMNAKMNEFYNNLKMTAGKLVVEFMPQIVNGLDAVSRFVKDIAFGFDKNSSASQGFLKVLQMVKDIIAWISKNVVEGWSHIFSGIDKFSNLKEKLGLGGAAESIAGGALDMVKEAGKGFLMDTPFEGLISPDAPSAPAGGNKTDIKQEIKFGSDKVEPKDIMSDMKNVFESTFRQMNQSAVK